MINDKVILKNNKEYTLRKSQKKIVSFIINNEKPLKLINAPTGAGKSLCPFIAWYNDAFWYVCSTKDLQRQLNRDYKIPILMGKANYPCIRNYYPSVEHCPRINCKDCAYRKQVERVFRSKQSCVNYQVFLNKPESFFNKHGQRNVYCDEADELLSEIEKFLSIELKLPKALKERPSKKTVIKDFVDFIPKLYDFVKERLAELEKEINIGKRKVTTINYYRSLLKKIENLYAFEEDWEDNWFYYYDEKYDKLYFKPFWLKFQYYAEDFWVKGKEFVLTSATLPDGIMFSLLYDVPLNAIASLEISSVFDPERSPVLLFESLPILTKQNESHYFDKLTLPLIEKILKKHANERGIIHSVSYNRAKKIAWAFKDRVILHEGGSVYDVLREFKKRKNAVLISPAVVRGFDFKGDLCRFIIFAKSPKPGLDKYTSTKLYAFGKKGELWYNYLEAINLVQGSGRGTRSEDDYCTTYVLDGGAYELYMQRKSFFPLWFRQRVKLLNSTKDI